MLTVIMLKGLPASGKTTWAKNLIKKNPGRWKRVNKDDLRMMMDNGEWSGNNERLVVTIRDAIIVESLVSGFNVVVDDTNFNEVHEQQIRDYVQRIMMLNSHMNIQVNVKTFYKITPKECIERDQKRERPVGARVIMDMYNQYLRPKDEVPMPLTPPSNLPKAILCDIDGTLAHGIGVTRKPHEYHKVESDTVDETIKSIVNNYPGKVILMSGRPEGCRQATERWLQKHNIAYDFLYMRSHDHYVAQTKDYLVKEELYNSYIRGKYNIEFVLDDRNQVVEKWREMGLKVLQVADGDF